jgi:hypothetical protein
MIDRIGEEYLARTMSSQNLSALVENSCKTGLRRAYFRIRASRNAAPINKTNNHASPTSNCGTLTNIPHKAPTIAAVRSSGAPKNNAAPVNGSHNGQNKNPAQEGNCNNERPQNRSLLSIGSDYCGGPLSH